MNILISNSSKSWGGNERWSVSAANALQARGHNVTFICRCELFADKLAPGVKLLYLSFRHELDLATYGKLRREIKENNIQLLLPTKRKDYYICGRIGKKMGLPVVFRLGITRMVPGWDLVQRYIYRRLPDAIIVNAKKIKEEAVSNNLTREDKVHVIYNGYEFPKNKTSNTSAKATSFAAAGRLTSQKGYDILLHAALILRQRGARFSLVIAGQGAEQKDYKEFIDNHDLAPYVSLPGHCDNVRQLFSDSDCVLIPSRSEGVPNTLFEAWSVRKPVIATNVSGIPEVVDDEENGLLTELDPDSLARAMMKMMNNPDDAARMGNNGYDKLHAGYSIESMAAQMEYLFEKLLEKKS